MDDAINNHNFLPAYLGQITYVIFSRIGFNVTNYYCRHILFTFLRSFAHFYLFSFIIYTTI